MKLLFQTSTAKRKALQAANAFRARVLADGGTIQNESFVNSYYEFMYRTWGYIPRRTYSALAGVQLNKRAVTNLLRWSEEISNAVWEPFNLSVEANSIIAPDGTLTADKVIPSVANTTKSLIQNITVTAGVTYTQSFYVKRNGYDYVQLTPSTGFPGTLYVNFNLIDGTIGNVTHTSGKYGIVDEGDGWYRIWITETATSTVSTGRFAAIVLNADIASRAPSFTGDGTSGVYIWGAQLQTGTDATEYIKTEATSVTGLGSYTPVVTNLQVYSEDLTQASGWSSEQLSTIVRVVNTNPALPFTYWNEIKENTANDRHSIFSSYTLGTNTRIISFYAKQGVGTRYLQLAGANLAANDEAIVFNLQNGTFKKGLTSTIAKSVYMIPQAEGYRCVAILQTSAGSGFQLNLSNVDDSVTDVPSYLGNGSSSIFVSGFQIQALNSYNRATDYVPSNPTFTSRSSIGTYFDSNGVLQTASVDEERIDHALVDGNWVSKGLLLESASTNCMLQSQFASGWGLDNLSLDSNNIIAPDGTLTGAKITSTLTDGVHRVKKTGFAPTGIGNTWVFSVFVKAGTFSTGSLIIYDGTTFGKCTFDLSAGTIDEGTSGAITTDIRNYGNGWYRVSLSGTTAATGGVQGMVYIGETGQSVEIGQTMYVWGAQLETGTQATSYIKTEGLTQTRNADISAITNGVGTASYVSKMYDMNPINPKDAIQTDPDKQPLLDVDADCSHRIVRFNGTNNYLDVDDLSILQNQPFNSIFAVKKTTYPQVDIGVVFRMMFSTSSTKLALSATEGNDALVARRTESDSDASVNTIDTTIGFASNAGVANWVGNSLEFFRDKETLGSDTFPSGAGNSDSNLLTRFWIGGANSSNRYYKGIISEFIADRSIYTQAQINALHDFFKQYYPTLP